MNDNRELTPNSPDLRGAVLAHVLHHVAMVPGPVAYGALFDSTLNAFGKPEEEFSLELITACVLLVHSGLLVSNTAQDGCLTISAGTTLTAAPRLAGWIWRDPEGDDDLEEEAT